MSDIGTTGSSRNRSWTRDEFRLLGYEIKSKFWGGMRGRGSLITVLGNLIGIGYATYLIPAINGSETSAETLGVYVLGFGVSLVLASIVAWIKVSRDSGTDYEHAVAQLILGCGTLLLIAVSLLSLKWPLSVQAPASDASRSPARHFYGFADWGLVLSLLVAISLSIILTGYDSAPLGIGVLDKPADELQNQARK